MKKRVVPALFILFLITSCGPNKTITKGSYIRLSPTFIKSADGEKLIGDIEIFYRKSPDFKFTEIGIVEAIAHGENAGLQDLFLELKKQAAKIGGDAVYKIELQRYTQTGNALHATGIAIIKQY